MKIFVLLIASIPLILWNQCSDESNDCICTEEFRMYLVVVVDTLGIPVDSLQTTIKNELGKECGFNEPGAPPYPQGAYFVMTYGYQDDFSTKPEKFFFGGKKNELEVMGEYLFNTDKCHCHIYKVAGPDTLVLK